MTNKEIIKGLQLIEDNLTEFDGVTDNGKDYVDVHEVLFNAIETLKNQDLTKNNQVSNQGDLISREALKKAFEDCTGECACCIHNTNDFDYCGLIDKAPTIERPTAEWITHENSERINYIGEGIYINGYECSNPYCCMVETRRTNYCPNCGAGMKGVRK